MKTLCLLLSLFCLSCSNGQGQSTKSKDAKRVDLPSASLEEAGFDRDSIENLIHLIQTTEHKDFRDWLS